MAEAVKILSGGLSTELENSGFLLQGDPLWSARLLQTNPQAIKNVHTSFLKSGAEVLSTATYQASVKGFQEHLGLSIDEVAELFHVGVRLAKEAAAEIKDNRNILIAGSIGPYGAFLSDGSEYTGNYLRNMSVEELKDWHRLQMQCLASAGIELFALETIPGQKEAEALLELLREFPNTNAWLSYSCRDMSSTSYGDAFEKAVGIAHKSKQLVAVGMNCCPPTFVSSLLTSANKNRGLDIGWIVYPNSGKIWDHNLGWQGGGTEKTLSEYALEWVNLGAKWIGGCCTTTPSAIATLLHTLRPHAADLH
ncbi:hypothetical protein XENTR_v10006414 [Xenopus tropicalis]|uniref:Uncharacterized protein LOC394486 isoform X1 n=1 Tax=Xenopus tropicalis TaxID=8364 RepID=F7CB89_XENTR|nr:uncharacterized protein LOC394486 isoform X1 [Xenopus tropicalis]KAE8625852.1 hypothetical protein XENTR_v10006414 [Xenopus tropicalis]